MCIRDSRRDDRRGKARYPLCQAALLRAGYVPVSYTHLDVYKRQVWKLCCCGGVYVRLTQFKVKEFKRILRDNGYKEVRCCGCLLYTSKGGIVYPSFNLRKALHIDTDGVRKLLLFHFPVFSYGLYVLP